jgi:hypothetical protein
MPSFLQASLTGGELSPSLHGRIDLARYQSSLALCRNFVVQPYGGLKNRAGTKFLAEVKDSTKRVRLIPFQFSTEQTYVLEFGHEYIRVFKDGGQVVYSSGPSAGDPVEVATPYQEDDLAGLKFTQSADVLTIVHPDHAPRQLSRTAHDAWTMTLFNYLNGPFQAVNSDRSIGVSVDGVVGAVKITATSAIFTADKVGQLFYIEQRDFGTPWEVNKTISIGNVRRSDGKYYEAVSAGTTGTLRPVHSSDIWNDGGVDWRYIHSGWGIAEITAVAVNGLSCTATVKNRLPDTTVVTTTTTTLFITDVTPDFRGVEIEIVGHGLTTPGYANVEITDGGSSVYSGMAYYFVTDANNLHLNITINPLVGTPGGTFEAEASLGEAATHKWAFGAWGGDQGWPSVVTYHQQRQVFAASPGAPQTIWMSRTGSYPDFGISAPIQDDDAVDATLASSQVNDIRGLVSLSNRLIVTTGGGIWAIGQGDAAAVGPLNLGADQQSFVGASGVAPVGVGNSALFVQDKGQVVRDLGYEFAQDAFVGNDLTVMASHLLEGKSITEWAWQQVPFSALWMVRDDGMLLSLTYMREQQVAGWARHETDGTFESVACISEGSEDVVYVAVARTIGGSTKRFIERMESRQVLAIEDAWFVDSGLDYDGENTGAATITITGGTNWDELETLSITASAPIFSGAGDIGDQLVFEAEDARYRLTINAVADTTHASAVPNKTLPAAYRSTARSDWFWARNTLTGLGHLEGKTVAILADGAVQAPQEVVSGAVTLNPPAYRAIVGLPYNADLQTLDPGMLEQVIMDRRKNVNQVRLLVNESRSIRAGRNFSSLYEFKPRSAEPLDLPPSQITGLAEVAIKCDWGTSAAICVRQADPLPINILALIPEIVVGGN